MTSTPQFRWSRFGLEQVLPALAILPLAMFGVYELQHKGAAAAWHGGFLLLVGCSRMLQLVVTARTTVVGWRIDGNQLVYRCLGAPWRHKLPFDDVLELQPRDYGPQSAGTTIVSRRGSPLWIGYRYLPDGVELIRVLESRKPVADEEPERNQLAGSLQPLTGRVSWEAILMTLFMRGIAVFFFACPLILGLVLFGIGLAPRGLIGLPLIFVAAGAVLAALCTVGIIYVVRDLFCWVIAVEVASGKIRYRQLAWPTAITRDCSEVVEVQRIQPATRPHGAQADIHRVRFADGSHLDLNEDSLACARQLASSIGRQAPRASRDQLAARVQTLSVLTPPNPQLVLALKPYLKAGERPLWIGRPVPGEFWSELAAQVVFGAILMLVGGGSLALFAWFAFRDDASAFFVLPVPLLFFAIGVYMATLPWRLVARLRRTLYAVTDVRAMVVGQLGWSHGGLTETNEDFYAFSPQDLAQSEVKRNGRDIVLGSEWQRMSGRRHRNRDMLVEIGFLAVDDLAGAESALATLSRS
jgi:hypothetical protein